ncbi:helix-turn-helix domain-containing protein [Pelosinus propionicus]|uniref:Helix-turn-helix domain-containing protein n=1 Tax=Pelosinus propionicus DSM 13327 TaxID=1123291 RepID=A0A1I4PT97_9FIRM|nr:helix-turn-helix domain-containing protein [Pelosinus propionicus]SFM31062.1 Helix-turn-helix domain-containing protein [Pelosinus propionicus DSM 13327]
MIKVIIPETKEKIQRQIEVLEYILTQDTIKKDTAIHQASLEALKEGLVALDSVGRKKTAPTEKIRKLREEGKTQEAIARELNISLSTVRRELKGVELI